MKKSFNIAIISLAAAGVLALAPQARAQAAFQNGSFESNGGQASSSATGWLFTNSGGNVPLVSNSEGATQGTFAVAFDPNAQTAGGLLSQSFATVALQQYTVTFDFGALGNDNTTTALSQLQVEVRNGASFSAGTETINSGSRQLNNGSNTGTSFALNSNIIQVRDQTSHVAVNGSAPNAQFSTVSFTFTAQSTTSTIAFTDQSPGGIDNQDPVIDNVTVTQVVPEPSTWITMLGGLGLLGCVQRFRRARQA